MIGSFVTFGLKDSPDVEPDAGFLGGKGAGLVWMSKHGIPVPPGFIIPTDVWTKYDQNPVATMEAIAKQIPDYMQELREHFGYMPLVSVRSGARVSCPGMMDTILNVGLDAESQALWMEKLGAVCYGNSLHRLITMYGSVVKGIPREELEQNLSKAIHVYEKTTGKSFPNAEMQLLGAIEAIFKSWDNERANIYRQMNQIPREWGTAVTVQAMVMGNLNDQSGTGVLFTRNPDTGEKVITGEFLQNAQGEDIVAGIRTPMMLWKMNDIPSLQPAFLALTDTVLKLETLKKDVQDVEFTVQDGKLYLLQTRNAKRSAIAAIKIALDMKAEGLIDGPTAVKRVTAKQFDLAQQPMIDPKTKKKPSFTGIGACSGAVSGKPVFSSDEAIKSKEPCILITQETTPDDIGGMYAARGVITMVGGLTSHAAVVARSMDRACICGVGADLDAFKAASIVTLDGATGRIWLEAVPIIDGGSSLLIESYKQMVADVHGIVPVLFDVPKVTYQEAVLYVGDHRIHPEACAAWILKVAEKVQHLYVDFSVTPAEEKFFSLFEELDLESRVLAALEIIQYKGQFSDLLDRLTMITQKETPFPKVASKLTLEDLILAEGAAFYDPGFNLDHPAVKKVLEWKKAEGFSFVSLGMKLPGMKSMLSVEQALQSA